MMTMYRRMNDHPRSLRGALLRLLLLLFLALPWTASLPTARAAPSGDLLSSVPVVNENALNNAACGVAAAAMVLDYYRQQANPAATPLDLKAVVQYVQQYSRLGKVVGTTTDQLKDGIEQASQAPALQVGRTLTAAWKTTDQAHWFAALQSELAQKRPLILYLADGHTVWPSQSWHYGHYIVVSGYTGDQSIIYHDPWDGQAHTLPSADFGRAWGTTWGNDPAWWYLVISPSNMVPANLPVANPVLTRLLPDHIATIAGGLALAHGAPTDFPIDPISVAIGSPNLLFIADGEHAVVWLANRGNRPVTHFGQTISPNEITVVAGGGAPSDGLGDDGPATQATLSPPASVAVDRTGNLYIADAYNQRLRRVDARTGIIVTVAGTGVAGFSGDGGPAIEAALYSPRGIAVDNSGNLYIADADGRVRRVDARSGIITTVFGTGKECDEGPAGQSSCGDDGPARQAELAGVPAGIAVDGMGNLYITDPIYNRVRRVDGRTGIVTTVAGNWQGGFKGDGGLATQAELYQPSGVAVDTAGNLYIADSSNGRVREVHVASGIITTVAGGGRPNSGVGDGGLAVHAQLLGANDVAVDAAGDLYVATAGEVRRISLRTGIISTVAGYWQIGAKGLGDGGQATGAQLYQPSGVAVDAAGNLYIADQLYPRVRRVDALTGIITTVAGNGRWGYSGDSGPATKAELNDPTGVAVDATGNLYIADGTRVRRVNLQTDIITTVAGTGKSGYSGDGGPATRAELNDPTGVAVDSDGNLYIADDTRVRRVNMRTGIITTVAGNGQACDEGSPSYPTCGDDGPAIRTELDATGVAVSTTGTLYLADNDMVRRVDVHSGIITAVAGSGMGCAAPTTGCGDGGPATRAVLNSPSAVAVDAAGNLYIAEITRVRRVDARDGIITTVTGAESPGYGGDGGPAVHAALAFPTSVAVDGAGNLYIADSGNHRVRVVRGIAAPAR